MKEHDRTNFSKSPRTGAQSVERALSVLACFAEADGDLGVSDVAHRTGLSVSTSHRLMRALHGGGLLGQDERSERYHLGSLAVALGRRAEAHLGFDRMLPALQTLGERTGESVNLGTRIGDEVLIVLHVASVHPLRFEQAAGSRVPIHASAMGKALLASMPDPANEVEGLGGLGRFTGHTLTSRAVLLADLLATNERGWAFNDGERDAGVRTIGAPLLGDDGRPWAAVAIQGPTIRITDDRVADLAAELLATAALVGSAAAMTEVVERHLAQFNVAHLRQPLDHPDTAEFVGALDGINALAESSPGFVWRLVDDDGRSSSYVTASDDPLFIINLSVWESPDALDDFVYRTAHASFLRRRRQWFERMRVPIVVCWWVPVGHRPSVEESMARLEDLRANGITHRAFTLRDRKG